MTGRTLTGHMRYKVRRTRKVRHKQDTLDINPDRHDRLGIPVSTTKFSKTR